MKYNYFVCVLILIFSSCQDKDHKTIGTDDLLEISRISNLVDAYYVENGILPSSKKDIEDFYGFHIDSLLENKIQKNKKIKYIPVYRLDDKYPDEYSIVSTNKAISRVSKNDEETFYNGLITICEYNNGKSGDILLYYSTPFLITSKGALFEFEDALMPHWRERIYFNVGFTVDSTINIKGNLGFTYNKDSVTINGTFYNHKVKEKVSTILEKGKVVDLQGVKMKDVNKNEFTLKDVVFRVSNDTIPAKYKNEIGDLKNYKHVGGCD